LVTGLMAKLPFENYENVIMTGKGVEKKYSVEVCAHCVPLLVPQTHQFLIDPPFCIPVVPLWNSLPSPIPLASSAATFKSLVSAYVY